MEGWKGKVVEVKGRVTTNGQLDEWCYEAHGGCSPTGLLIGGVRRDCVHFAIRLAR